MVTCAEYERRCRDIVTAGLISRDRFNLALAKCTTPYRGPIPYYNAWLSFIDWRCVFDRISSELDLGSGDSR